MRKIFVAALLGISLTLTGCNISSRKMVALTVDGFAQGTHYHVVYLSRDTVLLEKSIDSLLDVIDNSMSIFNPGSNISRLNDSRTDTIDNYIQYCITTARKVSKMSDGLYDITVKPLVDAWGFAVGERQKNPNIDSLLEFVGYDKISIEGHRLVKTDPRVQIDLNSIAKGYSASLIAQLIERRGIENYLVELGGEIVMKGDSPAGRPWRIGIDKPFEGNFTPGAETQVVLSLTNKSIATSGNYRNYRYDEHGRKIVHSINPKTGASSPSNVLSATVVTDDCAYSDALGTAMMLLGSEKAIALVEKSPEIWAYIIYTDDKGEFATYVSPELKSRLVE